MVKAFGCDPEKKSSILFTHPPINFLLAFYASITYSITKELNIMKNNKIKPGDTISILSSVGVELKKLGFHPQIYHSFWMRLTGTKQTAYCVWEDEESKQTYVTIDLCVEIPIQCCVKIQGEE